MKITQSHLTFYRQKKAPPPDWAKSLKYPDQGGSIDELINIQADKHDRRLEATNLCRLIQSVRRNFGVNLRWAGSPEYANLREYLYHLAFTPYSTDKPRRIAYAKRWFRKLYGPGYGIVDTRSQQSE